MISVIDRIRAAATDEKPRADASEIWRRVSPTLFDPHDERDGLRISDAGQCVRKLFHLINGAKESFEPEVQLFNLDDGTLGGAWWACLLAASLEADGYTVELEATVEHDGTPGHIDLYFQPQAQLTRAKLGLPSESGVVEFKRTNWSGTLDSPEHKKRYQVLQAAKYAAAKGCDDFAVVTIGPAARGDKIREDWFKLGDWQHALIGEWMRLSLALGPHEPQGDPDNAWRCRGCFVTTCEKNPAFVADGLLEKMEASYAARNG
jgi:hypothetical protein